METKIIIVGIMLILITLFHHIFWRIMLVLAVVGISLAICFGLNKLFENALSKIAGRIVVTLKLYQ